MDSHFLNLWRDGSSAGMSYGNEGHKGERVVWLQFEIWLRNTQVVDIACCCCYYCVAQWNPSACEKGDYSPITFSEDSHLLRQFHQCSKSL